MLRFMAIYLILLSSAFGSDFVKSWTPDRVEKLNYEIVTYIPAETVNQMFVEISRSDEMIPVFTLRQRIEIPRQSMVIRSIEKYRGANLHFVSSENYFKLPPEAVAKFGSDSIYVIASLGKDSIVVKSNSKLVLAGELGNSDNFITTTGASLIGRNMNFGIGSTKKYRFVNFLAMTGLDFKVNEVIDSVMAIEKISTPAGEFECYKVKNIVGQTNSYTYYSTDKKHIPVRVDLYDTGGEQLAMRLTLQKYESINN